VPKCGTTARFVFLEPPWAHWVDSSKRPGAFEVRSADSSGGVKGDEIGRIMTTSRFAINGLIAVWAVACSSGDEAAGSLGRAGASGRADSAVRDASGKEGAQDDGRGGASGVGGSSGAGGSAGSSGSGGSNGSAGGSGASGSSGSAGRGDSGSAGCTPPAPSTLVGWASVAGMGVTSTTGGRSASPMRVTTLAQLNSSAAGTNAAVIWLQGVVRGNVEIGSNKTLVGVCGAEIHGHVEMSGSVNVIVRNITIVGYGVGDCSLDPSYDAAVGCSSGQDAISLQKNAHHVWFDHCDISDGTDGNLDITNAANFVTISWTKFHYSPRADNDGNDATGAAGHRFSNLIGSTDSPGTYDDANALNVTWHHDWWADSTVERQPRVRFGKNHLFNNLWSSTASNYCIRAGKQAQLLLENNVFVGVNNPQVFNNSSDQATAFITSSNNAYDNTTGAQAVGGGGTPFISPPYDYALDRATEVEAAVRSRAGPE
jgi:pectate lyase